MRTSATDSLTETASLPQFDGDWEKDTPYRFGPATLIIEFLAGDNRIKVKDGGIVVKTEFPVAYGCILNTTDLHGEEIDFYLAPMPKMDAPVFIIDQIDPTTGQFDEHKVMFGFDSIFEVFQTYTSVFADGTGAARIGMITTFTGDTFETWLKTDGSSLKAASNYTAEGVTTEKVAGINPGFRPGQNQPAQRDEVGGVIIELPDLSKGPKIKTVANGNAFTYHMYFYCGLTHEVWSNPIDIYCRILDTANEGDTAIIHVASPGGSVILMGLLISAIKRTKAKVITIAEGVVASAATAIWAAGHERQIRPGAYFMQHMSSQLLGGKTTDIAAKSTFCIGYITTRLESLVATALFNEGEMRDMIDKSSDVYISGRTAIERVGTVSGDVPAA